MQRSPRRGPSSLRFLSPRVVALVAVLLGLAPSMRASAQYTPTPSASDAGAASGDAGTTRWAPPTPAPSSSAEKPPKPDPGPAVRERGAGRRRANPASGAFFALVIVAMLLYWVVKRLRR